MIDIVVPLVLLLILLFIGVQIAFALAVSGLAGLWMVTGTTDVGTALLGIVPGSAASSYALITVPMFVLLAYVASISGMAADAFDCTANWLSRRRGGLALATILASGVFGALSGSTIAAASSLGTITVPNMRKYGYSATLSGGVTALGATIVVLVPPSILMILYGILTETSISALLLAGLVPGLMIMLLSAITVAIWLKLSPSSAPEVYSVPKAERVRSTLKTWPLILIIVTVFSLLYSGFATATEVAGLGALTGLLVAGVTRRLSLRDLNQALGQTIQTTAMVVALIIGGTIFARYLTLSQVPQDLLRAIEAASIPPWLLIISIVVSYFILSMVMDELPLLLITIPLTFPVVVSIGYSPVWFGVITALMVMMGLVAPPVGIVSFIVSSAGEIDIQDVFKGALVFLLPVCLTVAALLVFPEIALWLPDARQR